MVNDKFPQSKKDILFRKDKSSVGKWDEKIADLCDKINSLENYYTTSSCSGRIVLIIDQDKKDRNLFVKVYHDKINFEKLKRDLVEILQSHKTPPTALPKKELSNNNKRNLNLLTDSKKYRAKRDNIKFKFEPCALHVACRTLEDAQELYDKAKLAGWKRSGIIASNNRFMVELNSTEKLEFPIIRNKKILVDGEFLKIVVDEANKKLEKSWMKIERLGKLI